MNNNYKRGQIYYINASPQRAVGSEIWSNRPGLIISNDINNKYSGNVEIVYLTTSVRKRTSPTHVKIRSGNRDAIALCEQIHSVDKSRIGDLLCEISSAEMREIAKALQFSLSLTNTPDSHITNCFKKWESYIQKYNLDIEKEQRALEAKYNSTADNRLIEELRQERDSYKLLYELQSQRLSRVTMT